MYLFFIIERFLKMFMDAKAKRQGENLVSHSHNHSLPAQREASLEKQSAEIKEEEEGRLVAGEESVTTLASPLEDREGCLRQDPSKLYSDSGSAIRASFGHQDKPHPAFRPTVEKVQALEARQGGSKIATVAWMIIFGDGIHNFIDGLSIGAAFSDSILTGISVSMKQALMYNFLSACTCYLGLALGILLGELEGSSCYIFGLAGGMFLYISLVDMMPELNEAVETASRRSLGEALTVFVLQNLGILVGIVCLFTLALYQDNIQIGGAT